ncbi:HAMP domain-containing protein [Hahella sp. KA22]|uniref:methyl-accepting chemotaxis protein n=1 Tax=Hahella sp. KA22 TaxID=1628392 RepID=UPI000FDCE2E2|nr:methyl-accepting chemotaxis protein [Hahella sp. KA22]AZZ91734.1 methyl-accepting chemotaxis protein [Hahella sp. KA22]QAY55104.1 HAMP domain-containing protein [Hahella sp. KA22]
MKIRPLFLTIFGVIIASTLANFLLAFYLRSEVTSLKQTTETRYASYQRADELRQSSDDLTRLARTYVVTGDSKYKEMYQTVLDIRNGVKPRPEEYHRIYWDLVLNAGDKPKPDGDVISLQKMMENLGFSKKEFDLLKQAQKNSDGLVNLEVEAMKAVESGNPKRAIELMHGQDYHSEKAKIMRPIDEFFKALEARTSQQLSGIQNTVSDIILALICFLILLTVAAIIGYLVVLKKIERPVLNLYRLIGDVEKNADLTLRSDYGSQDEIGMMAKGFNSLVGRFRDILGDARSLISHVADDSSIVARLTADSNARIERQANETDMVATAITEMTAAMEEVAASTNEAKTSVAEATEYASTANGVGRQSINNMKRLKTCFDDASGQVNALSQEFSQIENVLQVIKSIAEQTNLLALNAAIEAARAGEQGRGFAVVADEVRTLAKRTQESTGEIESNIAKLREGMDNTVTSMSNGIGEVTRSSESVAQTMTSLEQIASSIDAINNLSLQIASATEQQSATIGSIDQSVGAVRDLAEETTQDLRALEEKAKSLSQLTRGLQSKIQVFKLP